MTDELRQKLAGGVRFAIAQIEKCTLAAHALPHAYMAFVWLKKKEYRWHG